MKSPWSVVKDEKQKISTQRPGEEGPTQVQAGDTMMPKGVSFRVGDVAESLQNRRSPVVALQVHDKVRARCNDDEPFHNATVTSA